MRLIYLILLFTSFNHFVSAQNTIVLKGGTIIDVDNYGKSTNDISNAIVVISNGKITAVGKADKIKIPAGANVIDVTGKWIVPGLIEGFGSVVNQGFANAYLYCGVTSVVTVEDDRRGKTFWHASPSPALYYQEEIYGADRIEVTGKPWRFENINYRTDAQIHHEIDSMAKGGAKVMLIHYGVKPSQLPAIIAACKKHNIAMVGELGFTSYDEAVKAGIKSFVHTSRYTADILPDSVRAVYSNAPFGPPASYYYEYITKPGIISNPKLLQLAKLYSNNKVGLIPTGSLVAYTNLPFAKNPWKEPAAVLIDEKDIIHEPLDKVTGKWKNPAPMRVNASPLLFAIDSLFAHNGARFLTGSGATAFGTMPGISMITELEYLSHIGLSNREVIAAATNNFSLLWGWKHVGKVEAGRDADVLVLGANPLEAVENLKKIDVLVLKGKVIEREGLLKK